MDLDRALRTTGAVREFTDQPVADDVVHAILDTARFAPSGGNRQGWRVVVVRDPGVRTGLRDLYLEGWYPYVAIGRAGLVAWAPVTDREAEDRAAQDAPAVAARAAARTAAGSGGFPEHLDQAPVVLVLLADLRTLAAVDRDFDRYTFAGGASVYPFAWSILLAAHQHDLAGVMTTMVVRREDQVRDLLGVPDHFAVAGLLALGHPRHRPTRLRRQPVDAFTTVDRFDGPPFTGDGLHA